MRKGLLRIGMLVLVTALGMTGGCARRISVSPTAAPPSFPLTSSAFAQGETIPAAFTCDGEGKSVPLDWTDPPAGTQSFALVADDPDAPVGTWTHWVLYCIPAATRSLPEAVAADPELPDGSRHGRNSWRRTGYGGPCPPSGTHRYVFRLYALDIVPDLAPGASLKALRKTMDRHILAQGELTGLYARQ